MTFYQQQVEKLTREVYPHEYLTQKIMRAKRFMDERFAEDISLERLAAEISLSKFHFARLFKIYYGCSVHQYLNSVRRAKARELLRSGASVSHSCYAVGFSSLSSFTAFFRKSGGPSPRHFQRKKQV